MFEKTANFVHRFAICAQCQLDSWSEITQRASRNYRHVAASGTATCQTPVGGVARRIGKRRFAALRVLAGQSSKQRGFAKARGFPPVHLAGSRGGGGAARTVGVVGGPSSGVGDRRGVGASVRAATAGDTCWFRFR